MVASETISSSTDTRNQVSSECGRADVISNRVAVSNQS